MKFIFLRQTERALHKCLFFVHMPRIQILDFDDFDELQNMRPNKIHSLLIEVMRRDQIPTFFMPKNVSYYFIL